MIVRALAAATLLAAVACGTDPTFIPGALEPAGSATSEPGDEVTVVPTRVGTDSGVPDGAELPPVTPAKDAGPGSPVDASSHDAAPVTPPKDSGAPPPPQDAGTTTFSAASGLTGCVSSVELQQPSTYDIHILVRMVDGTAAVGTCRSYIDGLACRDSLAIYSVPKTCHPEVPKECAPCVHVDDVLYGAF